MIEKLIHTIVNEDKKALIHLVIFPPKIAHTVKSTVKKLWYEFAWHYQQKCSKQNRGPSPQKKYVRLFR